MAIGVPTDEAAVAQIDRCELVPGARLNGADLAGADLGGLDLSGVDLSGADLRGAKAMNTVLVGATLHDARLDGAQFLHADLTGADLTNATATDAGFGGADLSGAVLFSADLSNASLSQAILAGADLRMTKLCGARLRSADLSNVDASRADLTGADLTGASLKNATMHETELNEARLQGIVGYQTTDWIGCNASQADFTGAYLARRAVIDQNYLHEFRSQSKLHEFLYRVWWITSDCGRSYLRWATWTLLFAVLFAGLYELVNIDYGLQKTALSSLYFSVVTLTTLGYGDVLPASQTAQAVVMMQVIVGYVMLGGLLSIFSSKMSRRGD